LVVLTDVLSLAFPTVGALIASRLPTNPVGWLFCGFGLLRAVQRFAGSYADYALLENLAFPGGRYVAWFSTCAWLAGLALGVFLMLLFPDGRLPSRRWRIVAWAAIFGAALDVIGFGFMPEYLILTHPYVDNPFPIIGVIGGFTTYELFGASRFFGMTLLLWSTLAALFSPILRLYRTRGNERQQIKWFLFAAVPLTIFLGLIELNLLISTFTHDFMPQTVDILQYWHLLTPALIVGTLAPIVVPIFTYIAILKYRLYDIDVVINRTLVYGSLTAMLIALYFGGIVVLQRIFVALTGEQSTLAIVASTLLIAALFNPLRRRIQRFIDRRFYRRKYDARKTLEAFSATLRNETDLQALNDDLVGVVRETMQPAHVSLWLRPDRAQKAETLTQRPHA
jgi:MFS family permease